MSAVPCVVSRGLVLALLATLICTSCARMQGPYSSATDAMRDPVKAQRLTLEAAEEPDPLRAERLLRDALTADLYHGPAHNNLGVLYLRRGDLYAAASEFEWAKKLLPGHPDPRLNLALTLERAGRTDEAISAYAAALEVYDGHIPTIQALARLKVKAGRTDDSIRSMLEDIAWRGESQAWREWARSRLASIDQRRQ